PTLLVSPFIVTSPPIFYPLSLHDALPIYLFAHGGHALDLEGFEESWDGARIVDLAERVGRGLADARVGVVAHRLGQRRDRAWVLDRKSTRLNSSHVSISYAVFCLKKKKTH